MRAIALCNLSEDSKSAGLEEYILTLEESQDLKNAVEHSTWHKSFGTRGPYCLGEETRAGSRGGPDCKYYRL